MRSAKFAIFALAAAFASLQVPPVAVGAAASDPPREKILVTAVASLWKSRRDEKRAGVAETPDLDETPGPDWTR